LEVDIGGKIWEPLGSWYHATKLAVEGLSDSLRVEVEPFGIKVVVVEPGLIRTEWAGIAADGLLATSGGEGQAYRGQAQGLARTLRGANDARMTSDPDVVAAAITKAAGSARPRTRYGVGGGAPMILLVKRLLSDRMFDRFIRRTVVG
jgi:NAD(P)-dependent dehydrogenase (short-subunit alcohol dehydrogenase family)